MAWKEMVRVTVRWDIREKGRHATLSVNKLWEGERGTELTEDGDDDNDEVEHVPRLLEEVQAQTD